MLSKLYKDLIGHQSSWTSFKAKLADPSQFNAGVAIKFQDYASQAGYHAELANKAVAISGNHASLAIAEGRVVTVYTSTNWAPATKQVFTANTQSGEGPKDKAALETVHVALGILARQNETAKGVYFAHGAETLKSTQGVGMAVTV